jgi:hypothetical protein
MDQTREQPRGPKIRREGFVDDEPVVDVIPETEPPSPPRAAARLDAPKQNGQDDQPAPSPGQPMAWPFTYKLRYRPLKITHTETVDELTFREPNAGDILDFGNPVNIEVKTSGKQMTFDIHIDDNKMMQVLGNLVTDKRIMSPHLNGLDLRDYNNIANKLRRFFRPDWDMVNF